MGFDELPGGKCDRASGQFLVLPAFWPQEISSFLHFPVYVVVIPLRSGDESRDDPVCPSFAGRRRRRIAAALTIDLARDLSSPEKGNGDGRVRVGRGGRTGVGTDARRLAHRHLFVAV